MSQIEYLPAKVCPQCCNLDFNDDFTIMKCSLCHCMYKANLARDGKIRIEK